MPKRPHYKYMDQGALWFILPGLLLMGSIFLLRDFVPASSGNQSPFLNALWHFGPWIFMIVALVYFVLVMHYLYSFKPHRRRLAETNNYMTCPSCGYDCSANPDFTACPECGLTGNAEFFKVIWTNPKAK